MAAKPVNVCCVTIGFEHYLLPLDKGLKLVDLLQNAVQCEKHYESGYEYSVREQAECSLVMVKASQIRTPNGQAFTPVSPPARKRLPGA